jgi:hypothetical protein
VSLEFAGTGHDAATVGLDGLEVFLDDEPAFVTRELLARRSRPSRARGACRSAGEAWWCPAGSTAHAGGKLLALPDAALLAPTRSMPARYCVSAPRGARLVHVVPGSNG